MLGGVSPSAAAGTFVHSERITNVEHTHSWKEASGTGASYGMGLQATGVFVVFLRGVQGTEMVCGSKFLRVPPPCESFKREVRLCLRVHTARGGVRCSTPSCCP